MKIIKPSVEFFGSVPTDYDSAFKFIEKAGRTCYKSEDKITDDSAEKFVKKLINAGHLAMVEHSNFVVRLKVTSVEILWSDIMRIESSAGKYLNVFCINDYLYVGGNLTAWYQNTKLTGVMDYHDRFIEVYGNIFNIPNALVGTSEWQVCPHDEIPNELHLYSAKFISDRGVSHELVRHRPCSFAQESTRYVNYGGKDMEFIEPWWWEEKDDDSVLRNWFRRHCDDCEQLYRVMLSSRYSPQAARAVLPNALKTEIIVTATAAEWRHIRALRTSKAAHPDMQQVMNMMPWEEFL